MNIAQEVRSAYQRISPHILKTPATRSQVLSEITQAEVYLKNEHLQYTGSFKLRGALNKILSLDEGTRRNGVIAASTGNHGLGVSYAASLAGISATIYVPKTASPIKLKGISFLGGQVVQVEGDCLAAELIAKQKAQEEGKVFISPYNDLQVISGQGTIGLEIDEQMGKLDAVFVSVGGGGLISGIGSFLKSINSNVSIVGCWPENSPIMKKCIQAGKVIEVPEIPTLSDATAGPPEPGTMTLSLCQKLIDQSILVSEDEIKNAIRLMAEAESTIIEGSAGVAVAALLQKRDQFRGKKVAIVLCGRNIDFEKFKSVLL